NIAKSNLFPIVSEKTVGSLRWSDVLIGTDAVGPQTDSHVWLAPRKVDAANLTVGGESERYLFYRGVGHLDAPIYSTQSGGKINFLAREDFTSRRLWLARFGAEGTCQAIDLGSLGTKQVTLDLELANNHAPVLGLSQLRASMRQALISDGLFPD